MPMPMTLKTLPVLALLALAAPLAAQEAPDAQDPAATPPEAQDPAAMPPEAAPEVQDPAAPAPDAAPEAGAPDAAAPATPAEGAPGEPGPDLSLGEPAEAAEGEPQVGQPYIREEFGDWALRCLRTEDGNDPCQLYQLLLDDQGNAVAEISIFPLPEGQEAAAGAAIVAPLETLLTEDLTLSVDGGGARRYPFTFCNPAGCLARVGFTAEEVAQFRGGNVAQLAIVPAAAPDQVVELTISLTGFTAGYEAAGQSAPTVPE